MARETKLPQLVQLRLSDALSKAIDDWRRKQEDIPSRSEAIRRLVQLGLGAEPFVLDLLRTMEALPRDPVMDGHIANLRRLVEKGLASDR
jgi:Arc/MetJ-type ribon-helix-helix transcriptional regulator